VDHQGESGRLSEISTAWSELRQLHLDSNADALQLLVQRYRGAVYRYLLAGLKNTAAAEDLTQEFFLALMRGRFRHADPHRGRFRDYVRRSLYHLVSKFRKQQQKLPRPMADVAPDWDAAVAEDETDQLFNTGWRDELLARTWDALRQVRPDLHAVLRCKAEHPKMRSPEMAQTLGRQLGKQLTPDGVRQVLHRAREKFVELLRAEVAHSLELATPEEVDEELRELDLLDYCRRD
jgi:RNA polymerase sigma-70 factor (ECF subfamily)